jgi:ubiquinone/menaquinone biosynthesis C-methylase UbiE
MNVEQRIAEHYTRHALERAILDALVASGKDIDHLQPADLAPVDEFHIGGRQATMDFAEELGVRPGMHLLDVGSGIGGASRYFAHDRRCQVTGIDLTDEYVRVASALAQRVGLSHMVSYHQGSAAALPFAPATFDGAYMLHVGMNISDKGAVFAAVRRVLRPGGVFGIYDVMRERDGDLTFPVPWASQASMSFLASAATYRDLLEHAGFVIVKHRSRRAFAIEFFRELRARAEQNAASPSPSPLGLQLLMGADAPQKIANIVASLDAGLISPTEVVAGVA